MIFSIYLLNHSFSLYNLQKESFSIDSLDKVKSKNKIVSSIYVVGAILFFLMELTALYYSVALAVKCSSSGPERVINIILALVMPLPYLLSNMLFNKCIMKVVAVPSSSVFIPRGSPV